MTERAVSHPVHLVGSIPFSDTSAVLEVVAETLGDRVYRIPDGETGDRTNWIAWQLSKLAQSEQLELASSRDTDYAASMPQLHIRDDCMASDVELGDLGYRAAALASYREFAAMKAAGDIKRDCRFQVSLPTPLAPIHFYVDPADQAPLEGVYEEALLAELEAIVAEIPASELAVQWDTAVEFGILEGVFPTFLPDPEPDIVDRLVKLGTAVPAEVQLGYHLCYGDSGHRHFIEPIDTSKLVSLANQIAHGLSRSLQWVHLPVPKSRTDDDYYRPLSSLSLPAETRLFLGLIHFSDGLSGAESRIEVAKRYVQNFGVATECGFGRRPPETVLELLELHASACEFL
ncbi:MAG: hypothetical protein ACR2PZ_19260 [Pseudomonadales bacterium]